MKAILAAMVLGFVMPPGSVLKRYAAARDDLTVTSLRIEGLATLPPSTAKRIAPSLGVSWSAGDLTLPAVASIRFPGRCRLDVMSPDGSKKVSAIWVNGKVRAEGGDLFDLGEAFAHACALLTARNAGEGSTREQLTRYIQRQKVDTAVSSLGRFAGGVALVVGQRNEGAGQLWVSKDRFVPVRLRTDALDVRFLDFTSPSTGDWFPRVTETYRDGLMTSRFTSLAGDGRADLNDVKF
jgi:hypothetical protein